MGKAIIIPDKFLDLLSQNHELHASLLEAFSRFMPWISQSGMPFFPGFTDHSETHIQEVVDTAYGLIADEAFEALTSEDVAVLLLSILLHDAAMHLTEDMFRTLIQDKERKIFESEKTWTELWSEFKLEASRYDGQRLRKIYGNLEPADVHKINVNNVKENERLLIGEFVRINHTRMAHEFAVYGLPIVDPPALKLPEQLSNDLLDIAGLAARSHGFDIRHFFALLESKEGLLEFRRSHPIFLMAVLRIADYIQVQATRAPEIALRIKQIKSPVSVQEWRNHHAIKEIKWVNIDPEAVFIDALPEDVTTFLKLQKLLKDIQLELDSSWAAIGEVYGRVEELKKLKLRIRRVKSNIDNLATFEKRVNYVPSEAKFTTAGSDMLGLLVGPLYSNEAGVGIRELIQNALDACKEFQDLPTSKRIVTKPRGQVDVTVKLIEEANGRKFVRVEDYGVGMTKDVLINYFLKAGASFRNSDVWREEHEDDSGQSRVLRGGRFGVGVLAAFLLGPRINVVTRHITATENRAIQFTASLEDEDIQLEYTKFHIGTRIDIDIRDSDKWGGLVPSEYQLSEDRYWQDDSLDWYYLQDPSLSLIYDSKKKNEHRELRSKYNLPNSKANLPLGWHRVNSDVYQDIQWSFIHGPFLSCNGIRIADALDDSELHTLWSMNKSWYSYIKILRPNLSVFDHQALLPLNLQRNGLASSKLEFDTDLATEVAKEYLGFLMLTAPTGASWNKNEWKSFYAMSLGYHGIRIGAREGQYSDDGWTPLFGLTNKGLVFLYEKSLKLLSIQEIWLVPNKGGLSTTDFSQLPDGVVLVPLMADVNIGNVGKWFRIGVLEDNREMAGPFGYLAISDAKLFFKDEYFSEILKPKKVSKVFLKRVKSSQIGAAHHVFDYVLGGGEKKHKDNVWSILKYLNGEIPEATEALISFRMTDEKWKLNHDRSWYGEALACPIEEIWLKVFPSGFMPYHHEARMHAFQQHADCMKYMEDLRGFVKSPTSEYGRNNWRINMLVGDPPFPDESQNETSENQNSED